MALPNLFHYATSELSQDAFLCWMLAWAMSTSTTKPSLKSSRPEFLEMHS